MRRSGVPKHSELALVGAGPVGLETAALAAVRGFDVALFEKGEVGHHLKRWGHAQLFTPFRMNHSPWGRELLGRAFPELEPPRPEALLTGEELLRNYLIPLARIPQLHGRIHSGTEVLHVGKERLYREDLPGSERRLERPFRLVLREGDRETVHHAERVIDASGVYGSPRPLGAGGIPCPGERRARTEAPDRLTYGLSDPFGSDRRRHQDRSTLLVGEGPSAAAVVEGFSRLAADSPKTRLFWLTRSLRPTPLSRFPKDPLRARDRLASLVNGLAAEPPPWLRFRAGAQVEEILLWPGCSLEPEIDFFEVGISSPYGRQTLEVDEIVCCNGFEADHGLYRELHFEEDPVTGGPARLGRLLAAAGEDHLAQPPPTASLLIHPEPGFFVLGHKSFGRHDPFLLIHGIEQARRILDFLAERRRGAGG